MASTARRSSVGGLAVVTVVGTIVTDPAEVSALGVSGFEAAVDITEEMLRAAYIALVKGSP